MTKNPIKKMFSNAVEAARRLRDLPKIQIVSDLDDSMKDVIRIMENVLGQMVAFRQDEEQTAGALGSAFRPGSDLGDLLLFVHPDTPDDKRDEARSRFMNGRRPIHASRWDAYPEFQKELAAMSPEVETAMYATALFVAAQVLVGWEGRQPVWKEVELSAGFKVTVRELSPLEVADVLSGDPETLGDRMFRAGFVGAGAYLPMTEKEKDAFFADAGFNPRELSLLLMEIRGFILEVLERREEVVRKALATLANEVTEDLVGPGWRRKDEKEEEAPDPITVTLGLELAGAAISMVRDAVSDEGEEDEKPEILLAPIFEANFARDVGEEDFIKMIVGQAGLTRDQEELFWAVYAGESPEEIATRLGKARGTIDTAIHRMRLKIKPFLPSRKK